MVKDSPGFLVNRMLLPYLNEAVFMLEEGFSASDIDSVMVGFGMPEGPLELIKDIGLDVVYKASKILSDRSDGRTKLAESLRSWSETRKMPGAKRTMRRDADYIVRRLLGPMKTEAELYAREGTAPNREIIDLVLLLGAGFPSSRRIWDS